MRDYRSELSVVLEEEGRGRLRRLRGLQLVGVLLLDLLRWRPVLVLSQDMSWVIWKFMLKGVATLWQRSDSFKYLYPGVTEADHPLHGGKLLGPLRPRHLVCLAPACVQCSLTISHHVSILFCFCFCQVRKSKQHGL